MASKPSTPSSKTHIALELLSRAHSPDTTSTIFTEKVRKRPLHLNPTDGSHNADNARELRRHERERKVAARKKALKPRPLSAAEKRSMCIYELPKSQRKYRIFAPLHQLWLGYMREILGLTESSTAVDGGAAAKLASADYHGALLVVVRSRCVSRVGLRGIVVKDTKFTFEIVTPADQLKICPKEHTVFRFEIPPLGGGQGKSTEDEIVQATENHDGKAEGGKPFVFELHGEQFQYRAVDRANKKFKIHFLPDL